MKIDNEKFIKRVIEESNINKHLKEDLIYKLIDSFKGDFEKKEYPRTVKNPLEVALKFYEDYNNKYYEIILNAINAKKIIINEKGKKSFADTYNGETYISLLNNDNDIFLLVHEFAHYIDLYFSIIPTEYCFLCEVFSFYIEKKLEIWLDKNKFNELIQARRCNRIYFESKMLEAIEYEMFCERLYKESGKLELNDLDANKISFIKRYDYDLDIGLVNYLLRYPLANLLTEYLIKDCNLKKDEDLSKVCLDTNLYELLEKYDLKKILSFDAEINKFSLDI